MARHFSAALWGLVFVACSEGVAKDHFLAIGGGYGPQGNQLSIESNMLLFRGAVQAAMAGEDSCEVFFSDGTDEAPDVQYYDAEAENRCHPARRMLAEILGDGETVKMRYRNHRVPEAKGAIELGTLAKRFRELGRELQAGDRLILYFDGHGSEAYAPYEYDYEAQKWSERETEDGVEIPYNTFDTELMLWNEETVSASEFNRWLDRINRDVQVILIMGQCYAGGFSHSIFHNNNAELGLSPHTRCGFFAQVHDRPAAGCTPDNKIKEYGSLFWAALAGQAAGGDSDRATADYDNNGAVSFAEAHAYALLASDTFDLPVTASGALLRHYSKLGGKSGDRDPEQRAAENPIASLFSSFGGDAERAKDELRAASGPLADFEAIARPDQAAALRGLREKLELKSAATVESLRVTLRRLKSDSGVAEAKTEFAHATMTRAQEQAQNELYERWPELQHPFSPVAAELANERANEFAAEVNAMASYEALGKAREKYEQLAEEATRAEGRLAQAERLLQLIEEIALAENLPKVAPREVVDRYQQIVDMESQSLR